MINISIDPPDLKQLKTAPISQKEDLSINEIESVYELISEGVFENDVPEKDDNDIDTESQPFDLYCFKFTFSAPPVFNFLIEHYPSYHKSFSFECPQPNSPPPKYA
jgi:hypothetical protein